MMPRVTGSPSAAPKPPASTIETPAAKNANTGTANPADSGRKRCSKCSARPGPGPSARRITGTVKPSSTPATVACTPDSVHEHPGRRGQRQSSHQERTRRCTSTANSASGTTAGATAPSRARGVEDRDDGDREQVVDHGEGQQEHPQRGRQVGADHREHGEREGDVGGGRDRPPRRPAPPPAR
jgi:hypothetical protein